MNIALRERDRDIGAAEQGVDPLPHITFDFSPLQNRANADPEMDFEVQGVVAELVKKDDRFRLAMSLRFLFHGLFQKLHDICDRRTVGDSDLHARQDFVIR